MVAVRIVRALNTAALSAAAMSVAAVCGCKIVVAPTINIPAATQQAAAIERSATGEAPEPKAGQFGSSALEQAVVGRRLRAAEIQGLKNNRIVGENRSGYLSIIELPPGQYGEYAKRLVEAENRDRRTIYVDQASQLNVPLEQIETTTARVIYDRSFKGEWVEEFRDGKWIWVQKTTDRTEPVALSK
jgi:uncharacterized protein YdbL (DUF1318 family)